MTDKGSNKYGRIIGFLLQAGFFAFLGSVVTFYLERDKEFDLEEKKFQYELIKDGLSVSDPIKRNQQLSLYYDLGLLSDEVIGLSEDSLSYKLTYLRGKADGGNAKNIVNALKEFYRFRNKAPVSLNELKNTFNVSNAADHFGNNLHYLATGPKQFTLQFPGADGVLFTSDDKKYSFQDLGLE